MVRLHRAEEPEPDVSGLREQLRHCYVEDWVNVYTAFAGTRHETTTDCSSAGCGRHPARSWRWTWCSPITRS